MQFLFYRLATMTWTLTKEFKFEAAHRLPHHGGKCSRLHGHSWRGYVFVAGDVLQFEGRQQGMIVDYADIKALLKPLDHHYLNDSLQLQNPTSEAVAKWVFGQLKPKLPGLVAVRIDETCTSRCVYTEGSLEPGHVITLS